jgi:small subunit ribosomal protein S16
VALKIRLRRTGAKKQPSYRLVVAPSTAPRDGKFVEIIGNYNPLTNPPTVKIDADKARHWLSQGAQPTEAAAKLLRKVGIEAGTPWTKPASEEALPTTKEIESEDSKEE